MKAQGKHLSNAFFAFHTAAPKSKGHISSFKDFPGEPSKDFASYYFTNTLSIFKYSITKTKDKKSAFKQWQRSRCELDREEYKLTRREAKRVVAQSKADYGVRS